MQLYKQIISQPHPKCLGLAANYINPQLTSSQPIPPQPLIFQKSLSCLSYNPQQITLQTPRTIAHEVELGVVLGHPAKNITESQVTAIIAGYFLALDFTCSSIKEYRSNGWSYCIPKIRDNYLVVSDFIPVDSIADNRDVDLQLKINGCTIQEANTRDMVFNVDQQIAYISRQMTLNPGDMILTGTPVNNNPMNTGDHLQAYLGYQNQILSTLQMKVNIEQI